MKKSSRFEVAMRSCSTRYCLQSLVLNVLLFSTVNLYASDVGAPVVKSEMIVSPINSGSVAQMFLGLILVIALIMGLTWFLRRMQHWNSQVNGALKVLAVLSMGARERIVLLQVGEQQILVGVAPGRIQALHVLETPIHMGSETGQASEQFAARLKSILGRSAQS